MLLKLTKIGVWSIWDRASLSTLKEAAVPLGHRNIKCPHGGAAICVLQEKEGSVEG